MDVLMWTARVRTAALTLDKPINYTSLTLVERYGPPDTLIVEGDIEDLRPGFDYDSGIVITDDNGTQRFSGRPPQHPKTKIERRGDNTATLTYEADTVVLWNRICWPTPAAAWTAQTTAYDEQTAVHETRIIGYITRNAGSSAYHSGTFDRRVPSLSIPATAGRGTSGLTSARFENLGQLVAELAEAASLRVTIQQGYVGTTPNLSVVIDSVPDYSAWAHFGDADSGNLGLLDDGWRYAIGAGPNVILSAAGDELAARVLTFLEDNTRKTAWGDHSEFFIDQRGTDDAGELAQGLATAMTENAPTVEIEAPITNTGNLRFGPAAGAIPVGAKVTANLDGEQLVERIRQLTTTVTVTNDQETVKVEPTFGSPDGGLTIEQRKLREALSRIKNLEASL